jgi:hypothetical protein
MYGERRNAIREYVQNSFDSLQTAVAEKVLKPGKGKITLTIDRTNNSLSIYDNGIGLPHRVAVNTLTAVGASRKERGRQAGFRGIGRLAGIAFSNILQFRTKAAGDAMETIVQFDCAALREGMLSSGLKPAAELILPSIAVPFEGRRHRSQVLSPGCNCWPRSRRQNTAIARPSQPERACKARLQPTMFFRSDRLRAAIDTGGGAESIMAA